MFKLIATTVMYILMWIVHTLILKRMKIRMMERQVIAEAELITLEDSRSFR